MPHPEHAVDPGPRPDRRAADLRVAARPRPGRGPREPASRRADDRPRRCTGRSGLTDEEYGAIVDAARPRAEPRRARHVLGDVVASTARTSRARSTCATLPTDGPRVLVGPGEDAGVVDLGDGVAVRVQDGVATRTRRRSSRSRARRPASAGSSATCCHGGAAGGAARPAPIRAAGRARATATCSGRGRRHRRVRELHRRSHGGRRGQVRRPPRGEPDVNVMCVGFARGRRLVRRARGEPGQRAAAHRRGHRARRDRRRLGPRLPRRSRTTRDESRPSVQIGDPFPEKLLIEACLELNEAGLLDGLQDLGGAGLTCAVSESAARAGLGADLDLDEVPLREPGMEPFEILTSESQERMLASSRPARASTAARCARSGACGAPAIGDASTRGRRCTVRTRGRRRRRGPGASPGRRGPGVRPARGARPDWLDALRADDPAAAPRAGASTTRSCRCSARRTWPASGGRSSSTTRWCRADGGGPGRRRRGHPDRGHRCAPWRVSADGNGRYGRLDPYLGAAHAVAEAARNVAARRRAAPAITNCLNFGNPERPEVMWQFAETHPRDGATPAGRWTRRSPAATSRFYNESGGLGAIDPTPVDRDARAPRRLPADGADAASRRSGLAIYLLGATLPELGGSEFAEACWGRSPGVRRRSTWRRRRGCTGCSRRRRAPTCWPRRTTARTAGSRSRSPRRHRRRDRVRGDAPPASPPPHLCAVLRVGVARGGHGSARRERAFEELAAAHGVPFAAGRHAPAGIALRFVGMFEVSLADAVVVYEGTIPRLMSAKRAAV